MLFKRMMCFTLVMCMLLTIMPPVSLAETGTATDLSTDIAADDAVSSFEPPVETTDEPVQEPSETPAGVTEVPAEETTVALTEAPTQAPAETTEVPAEETTVVLTEAPTQTPAETTEVPADKVTSAPTEAPTGVDFAPSGDGSQTDTPTPEIPEMGIETVETLQRNAELMTLSEDSEENSTEDTSDVIVITVPETVAAGKDVPISWTAVSGAECYMLDVYRMNGEYCGGYMCNKNCLSIDFGAERLEETGSYKVTVSALVNSENGGYEKITSDAYFEVVGEFLTAPTVTVDKTNVVTDEEVTFTIVAPGASQLYMRYTGTNSSYFSPQQYKTDGDTITYSYSWANEGDYAVSFCYNTGDTWTAYSQPVAISVDSNGALDAPVVSIPDGLYAGEELTISWDPVDIAEYYHIYLVDSDGHSCGSWDAAEPSMTIPAGIIPPGENTIYLNAKAEGWNDGEYSTQFNVQYARAGHEFGYEVENDEYNSGTAIIRHWYGQYSSEIKLPTEVDGHPVRMILTSFFEDVAELGVTRIIVPSYDYMDKYYGSGLDLSNLTIVGWYGSDAQYCAEKWNARFEPRAGSVAEWSSEIPTTAKVGDNIHASAYVEGATACALYELGSLNALSYREELTASEAGASWYIDQYDADQTYRLYLKIDTSNGIKTTKPVSLTVLPLDDMDAPVFLGVSNQHTVYEPLTVRVSAPLAEYMCFELLDADNEVIADQRGTEATDDIWEYTFDSSYFTEVGTHFSVAATAMATGYNSIATTVAFELIAADTPVILPVEQDIVVTYDAVFTFRGVSTATGYTVRLMDATTDEEMVTASTIADDDSDGVWTATFKGDHLIAGTMTLQVITHFDGQDDSSAAMPVEVLPLYSYSGSVRYNGWESAIEIPDTVDGCAVSCISNSFDRHHTVERVKLPKSFAPQSLDDVNKLFDLGQYRPECVVDVAAGSCADFWRLFYNFSHWTVYDEYTQEPPQKPEAFYLGRNMPTMCDASSSGWIFVDAAGKKVTTPTVNNSYTAYWCQWSPFYRYVFSVCKPYTVTIKTPPPAMITAPTGQVAAGSEVLVVWDDPLAAITTTSRDYTISVTCDMDDQIVFEGTTQSTQINIGVMNDMGTYTITLVQDIGEPFEQTITQSFEVIDYIGSLDSPTIMAPATALFGQDVTVTWEDPSNMAESFVAQLLQGTQVLQTVQGTETACTFHMPQADDDSQALELTIRVESQKDLYHPGAAETTIQVLPEYSYLIENGTAIITGYNGSNTALEIPSALGGYPVSSISHGAFEGNTAIQSVIMPDSVISIDAKAFKNCTNLETVIGHGVISVGTEAFNGCMNLKCLELGVLQNIGDDAFVNVPGGDSLDITMIVSPDSTLQEGAFENNDMLGTVTYGEGVTSIPARAHRNNSRLGSVYLPTTLQTIGSNAFAECERLEHVNLYENVMNIADDAFSGSSNVTFIIYVYSMDTVSYVEQYAKDHYIPYSKELIKPSAPSISFNGNEGDLEFTVNVDEAVTLVVEGAPAEKTIVYLNNQAIAEQDFRSGVLTLPYVFTQIGDYHLYAVSCNGYLVSDKTLDKTVHVVNTTFSMDKEEVWTGENTHFEVSSSVLSGLAQFYADDVLFAETEVIDGRASLDYAFTKAGERNIYVSIGESVSVKRQLTVNCIAQLEQPVIQAEPIQYYSEGLTLAWQAVEHADGYVVRLFTEDYDLICRQDVPATGALQYSCTFMTEQLQGVGVYAVQVMDYGYQYDQNETGVFITAIEEDSLSFTMSPTRVQTGENVHFTVMANGATKVQLVVDGEYYDTYTVTGSRAEGDRSFTQSGQRAIAFRALYAEGWSEPCTAKTLTVTSQGQLTAPQVTLNAYQLLGRDVEISWQSVAHAEAYTVYMLNENGAELFRQATENTSMTVPAAVFTDCGTYNVTVMAYGTGYDQSRGTAETEVILHLPGPVIMTPEENVVLHEHNYQVTWQPVEGAISYVITLARKTDAVDAYGQPVYEKVWASPNEVVNTGSVCTYMLENLSFGEMYRVAVGSVLEGTGLEDASTVGWTERVFQVVMPTLTMQLKASPNPAWERQNVTITAVLNNVNTAAVLSDGEQLYTPTRNEVTENGREFVFVVTQNSQGKYVYTVTAKGTGDMDQAAWAEESITVEYLDTDKPVISSVGTVQDICWPGVAVQFEAEANAFTEQVDVYLHQGDTQTMLGTVEEYDYTLSNAGKRVFTYAYTFQSVGTYTLHFTPLNAAGEIGDPVELTVRVLPYGQMPAPAVSNLSDGDIVTEENFTVRWNAVQSGIPFGGYCVLLEQRTDSGYAAVELEPGQVYIRTGESTVYQLNKLQAGHAYRLHVFVLESGHLEPDGQLHGETVLDFTYRTVPAFEVTSITGGTMGESISARWNAPQWTDPSLVPDFYVVYWINPRGEIIDNQLIVNATESTLPAEKVDSYGCYQVSVYACMYDSWGDSSGTHAVADGLCMVAEPKIAITHPNPQQNTYLINTDTIEVLGTLEGGVKRVLVRLVDQNGAPVELISYADGSTITFTEAQVNADGTFYVKMNIKDTLQASVGNGTIYCIEAYGYTQASTPVIGQADCHDTCWIDTDDAEIQSFRVNGYSSYCWLFADQWMTAKVTTNQLVSSVALFDDSVKQPVQFTRAANADASLLFTSESFQLTGEGAHTLSVRTDGGQTHSISVYIVTRTDRQTLYLNGTQSAALLSRPSAEASTLQTVVAPCEVTLLGTCGIEYVCVEVNGQQGFMLRSLLDTEKEEQSAWTLEITESSTDARLHITGNAAVLSGMYCLVVHNKDMGNTADPGADMTYLRAHEKLITPLSGNGYTRSFHLSTDLGLAPGYEYEFAVISLEDANHKVIPAEYQLTYYFGIGAETGIIVPKEADSLALWSMDQLTVQWYRDRPAQAYQLELHMTYTDNGETRTQQVYSETFDPNDPAILVAGDSRTCMLTIPVEQLKQVLPEDAWQNQMIHATVALTVEKAE